MIESTSGLTDKNILEKRDTEQKARHIINLSKITQVGFLIF